MFNTPEVLARQTIDAALVAAGWVVQDVAQVNLSVGRGVAVREFPLKTGHGFADYLLFVHGKATGVVEAKPGGTTLTGVEIQTRISEQGSTVEAGPFEVIGKRDCETRAVR